MAELDTSGLDFGIENTMSIDNNGAGDQNLLNDLFSDETSGVSENADDLSAIEEGEEGKENKKPTASKEKEKEGNDNKDNPEPPANDPTALTNWLTSEEEEEEEEEEEQEDSGGDDNNQPASEPEEEEEEPEESEIAFDSLASELADLGVFSRLEGEEEKINISTPEEFLERFNLEKQRGAQEMINNFLGQFGQDRVDAFNAIYVNGVDPRDYFTKTAEIEDYEKLDLTKESNQERVVREVLRDQQFENEDIDKEIEKLKNYGDLEDASKRYHKVLVKKQKAALQQNAAKAQAEQQQKQAEKQQYFQNVQTVLSEKIKAKEFDGIPVNSKVANELQDFLLVDKWKTPSGEVLTDFDKTILDLKKPENHEQKVKVALLLKLLEKDPTLSTIQKRGVSKKSSQLFKDVARQKTTSKSKNSTGRGNSNPTIKSWFQ